MAFLPRRGVIAISGPDRVGFLQGLVSNDVESVTPERAVWSALLTPQGRYVAEFFILTEGERLLLDAPRDSIAETIKRLSRFRLRSKVTLEDVSESFAVHAAWGGRPKVDDDAVVAADPRLDDAGYRVLAPARLPDAAEEKAYVAHRIALGLPDHDDLEPEKTLLMEAGFGELDGISWTKGCYMGQELTARTRYRGLVKRRLVPVRGDGDLPAAETDITRDGKSVGTLRAVLGRDGLAMLRVEALEGDLQAGAVTLRAAPPAWLRLSWKDDRLAEAAAATEGTGS